MFNGLIICSSIFVAIVIAILVKEFIKRGRDKDDRVGMIPAGKLGLPFLGETLSFFSAINGTKGVYSFVNFRRQRYGKWFKTRIFGKIHVFVPSIEGAKTILSNEFIMFNKGYFKTLKDAVGKNSLFCVPQENHKRIRRILSDFFSMNSMAKFVQKFDTMLSARLAKLEKDGKSFVVIDFTMKLTFDAMCEMLMSITDPLSLKEIEQDCAAIAASLLSLPINFPGTNYYKAMKARERLMKRFEGMIISRRNGKESGEDFLQRMLEKEGHSSSAEQKLDDSEIMDNLLTLITAGQTTTATAMMWLVKFLHDNQHIQHTLREEQLSIARNKPHGVLLTNEDLSKMTFASKVIKETLRMSNILLWFPRMALEDCVVDGVEIKKGWNVNVDVTCIHYDPEIYKDPLEFNPSRFDGMQKPHSYIPFASGPRTCLGINMAQVTMLIFLHRLTSGYMWTLDDMDERFAGKAIFPTLKSGCPITLSAINHAKQI